MFSNCLIIVFVKKSNRNKNNPGDQNQNSQLENNQNNEEDSNNSKNEDKPINPIKPNPEKKIANPHLETEFEFNTTVHDLRRIFVQQKYYEEIMTNGTKTNIVVDRKTNYDIYIISEKDSDEENKNFFNKSYTASISISSQCVSLQSEDCQPKSMVDFKKIVNNIRHLDEIENLKDIPIPICLFNLTDNDVITSMTCPEALHKNIKQNMILDLYFFRPPAIKRPDKTGGNITITKWIENNKQFIRETNGGICDIPDPFNSFCTTDMNTTSDSNGNILSYDEVAFTNITEDEKNYYIKNKITKLIDVTEKSDKIEPSLFEQGLNKLLSKLEPYMLFKEEFSTENFKELYKVSKNITDEEPKFRNLKNQKQIIINDEEELFSFKHYGGVNIFLNLFNDIGYNTESMKAFAKLKIDDEIKEISNLKEFTNLGDILDRLRILSESGNSLASRLLNQTITAFGNITEIIKKNVTNINNLIVYKDLSEIFDSTLSIDSLKKLPISIVQETSNLKKKLINIFNKIENGAMKNNIQILNDDIYNYIRTSHKLIDNIFKNLNNLRKALGSSKSKLTEISTYYLNNTSTSYISTIEEVQTLLLNYYKDEYNLIIPKINALLEQFEKATKESIQKEEKIVDNLYMKLENKNVTIENANEDDYRNIKLDLYNAKNYINEIIEKAKEKIRKEMNLKDSGYFISNYDISSNNNSFTQVINEAKITAYNLDNDEYIDKIFDQTMIYFRENYTSIIKYMDKIREEQFPLNEDVLKDGFFSSNEQEIMFNDISQTGISISQGIINENDDYLKSLKVAVETFLKNNQKDLNELMLNLTILFSEESLKNLSDLYDNAFESCLEKIKNDIETNKILSNDYFKNLSNIVKDNNQIINLLKSFKTDEQNMPYILVRWSRWHYVYLKNFIDSITSKSKTQSYLNKYNTFKGKIMAMKNYINEQLYIDLKYEYKNAITKLRESLQLIKNCRISDEYPDFPEIDFVDNDITKINNLYLRLNKFLSDDIFNDKYVKNINEYKSAQLSEIQNIDDIIDNNHNIINTQNTANDYNNDFCVAYLRKKTYTCTNGAIYNYQNSDNYCIPLSSNSDNYKKLITISIDSESNMVKFIDGFNDFLSKLNNIVYAYSSKINQLKNTLNSLEKEIYAKKTTLNNLEIIGSKIKDILNEKYGDNIILASYYYYQKNIEQRLTTVFDNISNKWIEAFIKLKEEVTININNYKNSINEFGIMALINEKVITNNISNTYFDSINIHQKSEFNYTISYYYNYLLRIINSTHQYIISKIPVNKDGFNKILKLREKEVNNFFNNLISDILKSKNEAMSLNNQLYVLQVPITNFFKVNNILTNTQQKISTTILQHANEIYLLKNNKENDEASLSCRFYLENSENGKQIKALFEPIDNKIFIYLNLEKFKQLIIKNWIFDQDDFIKQLNTTLYNTNLETSREFKIQKDNYMQKLEQKITNYFTKESIVEKINNLYKNGIKELNDDKLKQINQYVNNILNVIKKHLLDEANRLNTTSTSYYKDFQAINNTIKETKENVFKDINRTIFKYLDEFNENMNANVYKKYIEDNLNIYLENVKNITSNYTTSKLLNSSYHIGEIINDGLKEIIEEYKNIVKKQIKDKYVENYQKLANKIDINSIKNSIYNEIEKQYNSYLLPSLKIYAKYNIGDEGYYQYDLSYDMKKSINSTLQTNCFNIDTSMNSIVGDNYEVDIRFWTPLDFSRQFSSLEEIKSSFNKFIVTQKNNEITNVNECLQRIIKENFRDLLNNLIPSFGDEFFKRIITYNENFKITSLYDNLHFALTQTLGYYISLYGFSKIRALTKDLKIKLYSLNNLDDIIQENNIKVLKLLNSKINEFITDSKNVLIQQYIYFIKNDTSISIAFNEDIKIKIDNNLNKVINEIETDYIYLLDKYLKEKLISSYTNILNEKTEEMIRNVRSQRELIKIRIDDLFSLNPDEVLNEINTQINNTKNSIKYYQQHENEFKISDEIFDYLNDYGKNIIQPSYEQIKSLLDRITKDIILINLDKNAQNYENSFNINIFTDSVDTTLSVIKTNYIDSMNESIYQYGPKDYSNNLDIEVNARRLRRLDEGLSEQETSNDYQQMVADKSIDEAFHKLLTNSENIHKFINTFELFDEFDNIIDINLNKFNLAYKTAKQTIDGNDYEEDIYTPLEKKLTYLKNFTADYYIQVNESFYKTKNYLINSINEINKLFNECANITYKTFEDYYIDISKRVDKIDNEQSEYEETYEIKNHTSLTQNTGFHTDVNIESFTKKAKFKFSYELDKNERLKMPKVYANVINLNRPKKVNFKIYSDIDDCVKHVQEIEIEFNDAKYSMLLDYNASNGDILANIISEFDSYRYSVERYTTAKQEEICIDFLDICFPPICTNIRNETLDEKQYVDVDEKNKKKNITYLN